MHYAQGMKGVITVGSGGGSGRPPPPPVRRLRVGRRFLATMLVASAGELASAFGWPRAAAGAALQELVKRGEAVGETGAYRPHA